MEIIIPGTGLVNITDIILDYNGTLAVDGILIPGIREILDDLSRDFDVHIITADTFGTAGSELAGINCRLTGINPENQSQEKLSYLIGTGAATTACIGNGKNDRLMIREAAIGIAVSQAEGAFTETVMASDIVCPDIFSALEFFRKPKRLIATMRD